MTISGVTHNKRIVSRCLLKATVGDANSSLNHCGYPETIIQESFWHSLDLSYAFGTSQWLNGEFVSLVDFDFVEYLVGLRAKLKG